MMNGESFSQVESSEDFSKGIYEREWTLDFHGTEYCINITAKNQILTLDIETAESCDRWSNQFSAQYIEEITHKAGSFKKFEVFVKMLASAFSKESDSVFADILTYSDLEILKARKLGSSSSENRPPSSKSHLKRYVILTYAGEFDRVHFPLPLAFQDDSNVESLKRTVQRLRKKLDDNKDIPNETSDKNREMRQIVAQLRQENTELRHRVRQYESRLSKSSPSNGNVALSELSTANMKLRKQNEALKKEIADVTVAFEKFRVESNKEIMKWKNRLTGGNSHLAKFDDSRKGGTMEGSFSEDKNKDDIIRSLKRRIIELERNQFFERQYRGHSNTRPSSTPSSIRTSTKMDSRTTSPSPRPRSQSKLNASVFDRTKSSTTTNGYGWKSRPRSSSPSSSLGGKFDPTAYHQHRTMTRSNFTTRPLSATKEYRDEKSPRQPRDPESGYSSQSSTGSRQSHQSRSSITSKKSGSERKFSSDESDSGSFERRMTRKKSDALTKASFTPTTKPVGIANLLKSNHHHHHSLKKSTSRSRSLVLNNHDINKNQSVGSENESLNHPNTFHNDRDFPVSISKHTEPGISTPDETKVTVDTRKSIEESLKKLSRSIDRSDISLRSSRDSGIFKNIPNNSNQPHAELSDIDKRIQALQSFLDTARSGIINAQS